MNRIQYFLVFMALALSAQPVLAATKQLDVIGVIPGVSTEAEVESIKGKTGYEIGGFDIYCIDKYIDGALSQFVCLFGEVKLMGMTLPTKDIAGGGEATNREVFDVLLKGFSKKFGKPRIASEVVRNGMGTEFTNQLAVWKDRKGNKLQMSLMAETVSQGVLFLESRAQLDKEKREKAAEKKSRENF